MMKEFNELLNTISKEELKDKILSNFQSDNSFESSVFKKIGKRKRQVRINVAVSIIFTFFGVIFGYFLINNISLDRNMNSIPKVAKNKLANKKSKEEVWVTDDVYFSTYDEKANYAIEQVSLTNYDEEI